MTLALTILALLVALALSFFFSGSETGLISANRYRLRSLRDQGDASAERVLALLGDTRRLLVMALVGTNLGNVLAALLFRLTVETGWPATAAESRAFGPYRLSEWLGLLILTPIVIVFAEILPKALFRARIDRWIGRLRPIYVVCLVAMRPAIWVIELAARTLLAPWGDQRERVMRRLTREDVVNLVAPVEDDEPDDAVEVDDDTDRERPTRKQKKQPLGQTIAIQVGREEKRREAESDERGMVHNIMRLQETRAAETMTPLVDLVSIRLGTMDLAGVRAVARATGFSRFPVYRDRIVDLIGFVDVYRILRDDDTGKTVEDYIETPFYIPETQRMDALLREFLEQRIKNVIVVDEYGGCVGWITREDLLEEIVGELEDELDRPSCPIHEEADGEFLIEGRAEIDRVNEALGTEFDEEDWETMAGLILNEMGRIPTVGDTVTIDGWRMEVTAMAPRRIERVKAVRERARRTETDGATSPPGGEGETT